MLHYSSHHVIQNVPCSFCYGGDNSCHRILACHGLSWTILYKNGWHACCTVVIETLDNFEHWKIDSDSWKNQFFTHITLLYFHPSGIFWNCGPVFRMKRFHETPFWHCIVQHVIQGSTMHHRTIMITSACPSRCYTSDKVNSLLDKYHYTTQLMFKVLEEPCHPRAVPARLRQTCRSL